MNYEQMIRETDELIRDVIRRGEIGMMAVCAFLLVVIGFMGWLAWQDHREKKRQLKAQEEWQNAQIAMGETQTDAFGNTFYRMR